jgi:hypothetical protein
MNDAAIEAEIKKLEDRRYQAMIDSDFDTLGSAAWGPAGLHPFELAVRHPRRIHRAM